MTSLKNDRFLDLLGVKYGLNEDQTLQNRPGAVPRFAAFSSYIVEPDNDHVLTRLMDPSFNPMTTLALTETPRIGNVEGSLAPLDNVVSKSDTLVVAVPASVSRLIFFGDKYTPGWNAYWNGQKLQILKANFIFMAVVVPPGAGELEFCFEPQSFFLAVKVSLAAYTLMGILGIVVLIRKIANLRQNKLTFT